LPIIQNSIVYDVEGGVYRRKFQASTPVNIGFGLFMKHTNVPGKLGYFLKRGKKGQRNVNRIRDDRERRRGGEREQEEKNRRMKKGMTEKCSDLISERHQEEQKLS
jgi:hypothetical protein